MDDSGDVDMSLTSGATTTTTVIDNAHHHDRPPSADPSKKEDNDNNDDDAKLSLEAPQPPFCVDEKVFCRDDSTSSVGKGGAGNPTTTSSSNSGKRTNDGSQRRSLPTTTKTLYYEAVIRKIRYEAPQNNMDTSSSSMSSAQQHQWSFYIHFLGWNSRWDRWVSQTDIIPDTIENRLLFEQQQQQTTTTTQQQQRSDQQLPATSNAPTTTSTTTSGGTTSLNVDVSTAAEVVGRSVTNNNALSPRFTTVTTTTVKSALAPPPKRRCGVKNNNKSKLVPALNNLMYSDYCELPFTLKTVLVEENEWIMMKQQLDITTGPSRLLHHLPAAVPIRKVLDHFSKKKMKEFRRYQQSQLEQQQNRDQSVDPISTGTLSNTKGTTPPTTASHPPPSPEVVQAFCHGMTQLFNDALPVCLLYPPERPQYAALEQEYNHDSTTTTTNTTTDWTKVYGCEYLLRLYVRLPILLQQASSRTTNRTGATTTASMTTMSLSSPTVLGPLLTEVLVLMQKNKSALFPRTIQKTPLLSSTSTNDSSATVGNYRLPIYPIEWMDWECQYYRGGGADDDHDTPNNNEGHINCHPRNVNTVHDTSETTTHTTTAMDTTTTTPSKMMSSLRISASTTSTLSPSVLPMDTQ